MPNIMFVSLNKKLRHNSIPIIFRKENSKDALYPCNDALVVRMIIDGTTLNKVLIDPGSSVNILLKYTLDILRINCARLEPLCTSLYRCCESYLYILGKIHSPITISGTSQTKTMMLDFIMVDTI